MAEGERPRLTRRERLRRLGKLRILCAAIVMVALGYAVTMALDKGEGKPPPDPHQILDQAH